MTPDQERLVLETLPIVKSVAGAYVRRVPPHMDRDSIVGAAIEGLVRAAGRFDGSCTWNGYAHRVVVGAMLDEMRRQDPAKNRAGRPHVEMQQVTLLDSDGDELAAAVDEIARARARLDILAALEELPERARHVIANVEVLDRKCLDVACDLGLSPSRVTQVRKDALAAMKERLAA